MLRSRTYIALALALLLPLAASPGTIVRGTKSSGGTAFQSGETIKASEVNTDFDTIYTAFNGNVESINIKDGTITSDDLAANALTLPVVDDEQGTTAELFEHADGVASSTDKYPDRNSGTPNGLATTAAQELYQVRRALRRLAVGDSCVLSDGDVPAAGSGGTQAKACAWFDRVRIGHNLIRNGDFEAGDGSFTTTEAPPAWTKVGSPTAIAYSATPVSEGDGNLVSFDGANASEEGFSQTLAGLKASSRYLVLGRTRNDTGTGCGIETTGANASSDFPNLDLADDSGSTFGTLSGIVETDSTPTDIVVRLVTDGTAATDDCAYDHIAVYELNVDPIPQASRAVVWETSSLNDSVATVTITNTNDALTRIRNDDDTADLEATVAVPSPNCTIEVMGRASFDASSNRDVLLVLEENGSTVSGSGDAGFP